MHLRDGKCVFECQGLRLECMLMTAIESCAMARRENKSLLRNREAAARRHRRESVGRFLKSKVVWLDEDEEHLRRRRDAEICKS